MAQYGSAEYWEERYSKDPEPFEWYQRYSGIKDLIGQNIRKAGSVLNIGAGNSRLTEDMYEDGYRDITNIDISPAVVDMMSDKHRDKSGILWYRMDAINPDFPEESFDAVIDKGTLDSILCGENSTANSAKMLSEISRLLKPGGVYFVVSYGIPENRLTYLENESYGWRVTVHTVAKPTVSAAAATAESQDATSMHYIYVCRKS